MITKVFAGDLAGASIKLSDNIGNASAIYITAPNEFYDVEIDIWLQIYLPEGVRRIRLTDDVQEIDTETLIFIPSEYQFLNVNKNIAIYSDGNIFIECYAVTQEENVNTSIIKQIQQKLAEVQEFNNILALNQTGQNAALIAIAGGVGVAASVITGGASLALPGAVNQILMPSTSVLLPLLP